jgi:hypothetical protein
MMILIVGLLLISGCNKESKLNVPISFTDKDGNIFILIDTINKSFDAYSSVKITNGHLKGIFSDTIRTSFDLAIMTDPYFDTAYHTSDTIILPTHFTGHTQLIETDIDLKDYSSPYHFLLLGLSGTELKRRSHGNPSILLTIDTSNN